MKDPGISAADIEAVVGWTVIRTARQARRMLAVALKDHNLTPVEFGILSQLAAAEGEMTQADVARAAEIRAQSAAPIIDGLCDRGLLRREGTRGRGRSGRLLLSESGEALVRAAFPDVLATNDAFTTAESRANTLNDLLLHSLERIHQTKKPG